MTETAIPINSKGNTMRKYITAASLALGSLLVFAQAASAGATWS